jgi:hypothetical protein
MESHKPSGKGSANSITVTFDLVCKNVDVRLNDALVLFQRFPMTLNSILMDRT